MGSKLESLQAPLTEALQSYNNLSQAEPKDVRAIETAKARIHFISSQLAAETADPLRKFTRIGLMPGLTLSVRIAIDLKLHEVIETPISLPELSQKTGADSILLRRLLRILTAFNIFDEVGEQEYSSNRYSQALKKPEIAGWIKNTFDNHLLITQKIPEYLAKTQYKNPQDYENSLARSALGMSFFQHLQQDADRQLAFDLSMKMQNLAPPIAVPTYPFDQELEKPEGDANGQAVLVDIGGGQGQFLESTMKTYQSLAIKYILQDTETTTSVISQKDVPFEVVIHDFFTPQPVYGARWYHLRRILHDWPDSKCREILESIKPGFKKGYSKILLHEFVLPEKGCTQEEGLVDIIMLTLNAMERTKGQWVELLDSAGFKIVKVWPAKKGALAILEVDLKD